jgi:hypothetical protein
MTAPDRRVNSEDRRKPAYEIACVNCGTPFASAQFDAQAFCSAVCHDVARAIRYGRKQVARFGPCRSWQDEVLLSAVGRIPDGTQFSEVERRWNAVEPERDCDSESWPHDWLLWVARNRKEVAHVDPRTSAESS